MAKSIECQLIFHGIRREINVGIFPSKMAAREAAKYWTRPYTIRPIITKQL